MAYRRKSSSFRARKRTGRFAKRGGARPRSQQKRRTYRKNPSMTKKRILNLTSRKKRDTMMVVGFNSAAGAPTGTASYGIGVPIQAGRTNTFVWQPTGRDLVDLNSVPGSIAKTALRTSSTIYLRLLSEKITFTSNSSVPWLWRRIVYTGKGPSWRTTDQAVNPFYHESSNGWGRLMRQTDAWAGQANQLLALQARLFKGERAVDWLNQMTAPTDSARATILYDKTTSITTSNQSGMIKRFRRTHVFNKNLVYDDDESGEQMTTNFNSVEAKPGMGDVYVMDIFSSPGTATDLLYIDPEASLYWHEK